jgi:hypothetical protein
MDYYYKKGPEWYRSQFNGRSSDITFEATPHYLYFPAVPERVYAYQQAMQRDMKFIVLLREPAERSYSAWNMERSFHKNDPKKIIKRHYKHYNPDIKKSLTKLLLEKNFPSFQQAVSDDKNRLDSRDTLLEPSYVRKGLYYEQVIRWLKWFDIRQFLFLESRELSDHPWVVNKIAEFLDVSIEFGAEVHDNRSLNIGQYPPLSDVDIKTMEMLKKIYYPYNEKLFEIIGKRYDWND